MANPLAALLGQHAQTRPKAPASTFPDLAQQVHQLAYGGAPAWDRLLDSAAKFAVDIASAAAIFLLTVWVAGWAARLASGAAGRLHRGRAPDLILQSFIGSLARYGVMAIGLIAVLQQLGVKTASVIAVLGAASLAIGLALQGGLSNVASGVMILLLRPYRVGDRVRVAGQVGRVRGLDLFLTRITDLDEVVILVPNSKVFSDVIVNYTKPQNRRIVLEVMVKPESDISRALDLLLATARAEKRVAARPEPWARLTDLKPGAATLTLRVWAAPTDHDEVRTGLLKDVLEAFAKAGIALTEAT
ncbi:MAG: mechanosensitive ion channel family protein [Caulobacteraceae bacterium]